MSASLPDTGSLVDGRYRLGALIGEGSMARVFRAHDTRADAPVALKLVHRHFAQHPGMVERFQREMAITASIVHPAVVAVRGFGVADDGTPYLAMELLEGRTLTAVIAEQGVLAEGEARRVAASVADALAAAHDLGFVHRDLKPDNVLLVGAPPAPVKVLDFGISRTIGSFADDPSHQGVAGFRTLTRVGVPLGTPAYMSPEQVAAEPTGPKSDLYSLGVLLYEMLAGKPPFEVRTPRDAARAHLQSIPPALGLRVPRGLPAALLDLVDDLLNKDPQDRPPDARAVAARLRRGVEWTTP